jgi:hypothetical protein
LLTTACIQAFGISARPETAEILESLKSQALLDPTDVPEIARSFTGDVLQAAFYLSIVKSEGTEGFWRWFFAPATDVFDADGRFGAWTSSAQGKEWGEWYGKKQAEIDLRRERMVPPTARR